MPGPITAGFRLKHLERFRSWLIYELVVFPQVPQIELRAIPRTSGAALPGNQTSSPSTEHRAPTSRIDRARCVAVCFPRENTPLDPVLLWLLSGLDLPQAAGLRRDPTGKNTETRRKPGTKRGVLLSAMPTSRPGSAPVEFWVDGSRRDGAVEEFYTLSSELGRGATSIVYRCEEKQTQKPYALKVLKKTIDKKIVRTEIGVLLRLHHPNIIQLKDIFETDTDIALVLELVTGGELFDRIVERGYYSERDAAHVIKQILEAVAVRAAFSVCSHCQENPALSVCLFFITVTVDDPAPSISQFIRLLFASSISVQSLLLRTPIINQLLSN
ncbi:hypothetical protein NQZ68_017169 [Dissostichus eleginoides]|nr:hypothetical protein NQZ68_017169 [Dissostichus eleginoides]